MILLYMMNTSSFYREKKFEIINFKYDQMYQHTLLWWGFLNQTFSKPWSSTLLACLSHIVTGMTRPKPRTGRQDKGKEDPGNKLQRKEPPTPPKSQRKLNPRSDLLPLWRTSCLWTDGVPPFHATQDSVTLLFSLPKVQSQGIISLSLHTIKSAGGAGQITCSGLGYVARGGTKSRTDVHFSPTGTTAGMPLNWVILALTKDMLIQRNVHILHWASGPGRWYRNAQKCVFQWLGQDPKVRCGRLQ